MALAEVIRAVGKALNMEVDKSASITTIDIWDSLAHIGVIMEVERQFGIILTDWEAIEATSVEGIVAILTERSV